MNGQTIFRDDHCAPVISIATEKDPDNVESGANNLRELARRSIEYKTALRRPGVIRHADGVLELPEAE